MKYLLLFLLPIFAFAQEDVAIKIEKDARVTIPIVGREPIREAKIIEIQYDRMVVISSSGVETILYSQLPLEWQKAAGWPKEKVAKFSIDAPKIKFPKNRILGAVIQVLPEGLLIKADFPPTNISPALFYGMGNNSLGQNSAPIQKNATPPLEKPRPAYYVGTLLLLNHPKQKELVDGDGFDVDAEEVGQFQYTDAQGSVRTVKKFSYVVTD